jgi:hypothetical protein
MKNLNTIDRRAFLRRASSTALTLPLIGLGVVELTSCAGATSGTVLQTPILFPGKLPSARTKNRVSR